MNGNGNGKWLLKLIDKIGPGWTIVLWIVSTSVFGTGFGYIGGNKAILDRLARLEESVIELDKKQESNRHEADLLWAELKHIQTDINRLAPENRRKLSDEELRRIILEVIRAQNSK